MHKGKLTRSTIRCYRSKWNVSIPVTDPKPCVPPFVQHLDLFGETLGNHWPLRISLLSCKWRFTQLTWTWGWETWSLVPITHQSDMARIACSLVPLCRFLPKNSHPCQQPCSRFSSWFLLTPIFLIPEENAQCVWQKTKRSQHLLGT